MPSLIPRCTNAYTSTYTTPVTSACYTAAVAIHLNWHLGNLVSPVRLLI